MPKSPGEASHLILRVAIAVPLYRLFDYLTPNAVDANHLAPGIRLEVPFGTGKKIAYLIEISQHSEVSPDKLKPIERILDDKPLLSAKDIRLLHWASRYYHHPLGEVFSAAFPASLRKGKASSLQLPELAYILTDAGMATPAEELKRSPKQQQALAHFQRHHPASLSETELAQWDKNWRPAVKALLAKTLLKQIASENPYIPQHTVENALATTLPTKETTCDDASNLQLNAEQQAAIAAVVDSLGKFAVFLLEGVTGSGKTEVYMQIIRSVLERGQQVLVLVPEINLTPQLEERFRQRFSVVLALSHSNLTDKQRHSAWLNMQQGTSAILLGTRSALFTPLKKPGLIILDEEHDASFKQQEGFRFSARDVAIMRGKLLNIPVLLGSATPSLESLHNANQQRYQHLVLSQRAGNAVEPSLHLLDIRNKKLQHGLSETLVNELRSVLANGEQVLIFLNRRGFAPTLICHGCGWVARCRHCDANMVIHNYENLLRCHHCGREQRLLPTCPACKVGELMPLGLGTERVEEALRELFPEKALVRLDRDTTQRKGSLERYLTQINNGEADIILGTQMLAKGHHFPNVTLVAIVDVDSGLFSIDYHATERLAQMITQVSGRAGRAEKPGKVILQTRHPDHTLLNTLIREGYSHFAQIALAERKEAALPPFSYHALLRAQAGNPNLPLTFLQAAAALAKTYKAGHTQILGPVSAPMEKRAGLYRYQLLFQSNKRSDLQLCLTELIANIDDITHAKKIRWSLDVDPVDLF
ncbi:primosomal protein N' [Methyloglobulus sp.]|uniref:primosomal protein N' n=1 Tax=Methyloglobulus sp. TaxID=2518622 RepID=UPI0032B78A7B